MGNEELDTVSRWAQRRWLARVIRAVVLFAPLLISIGVAWTVGSLLPRPATLAAGVLRWVLIAALSTLVLLVVDKAARRLLPLAALYGLTLAFPDQAPSRFQLALRRGSTAQLRRRIAEARAGNLGDTPEEAAAHVLELAMALSVHDRLTRGHSERVRAYTEMIGEQMGLTSRELDRMRWAGLLHDIGKLLIPGEILNKPGKLTVEEYDIVKQHPDFGRELVAPLVEWLGGAASAVWQHHERWDGLGYPLGLKGTEISLAARIVAVADSYDVMTSARSYKKPVSPAAARAELKRCSGTHFDAVVVRAFMNVSLGRLRFALGPLGWLAQVPMLPGAFAATATQTVTATAATVAVGATAAGAGLGLSGHVPIGGEPAEAASVEVVGGVVVDATEAFELDLGVGTTVTSDVPVTVPALPGSPGDGPGSEAANPPASTSTGQPAPDTTASASGEVDAGSSSTSTSTAATTTTTVTTIRNSSVSTTTVAAGSATTSTTVTTTTSTSTTSSTTPAAPVSTTTSTTVPRPSWLPERGVPTQYFLVLPGNVDLSTSPVLALDAHAPIRSRTKGLDPDHDRVPGLRLPRLDGDATQPGHAAAFAFGGPDAAHVTGATSAVVYVASGGGGGALTVRGRLMICDGVDAASACAVIVERSATTPGSANPVALSFDFGGRRLGAARRVDPPRARRPVVVGRRPVPPRGHPADSERPHAHIRLTRHVRLIARRSSVLSNRALTGVPRPGSAS